MPNSHERSPTWALPCHHAPSPILAIPCKSAPRPHITQGFVVAEAAAVYRPRHPEHSNFYRLLDQNFDRYLMVHAEAYERNSGPLRTVVTESVNAYLDCGRLKNGFTRLRCPACQGEHLLAFSCQTRNFCPSCQAKRAALFAEHLGQEILAPVPHRHIIFTIPKALRGLMLRERRLLGVLARCAFQTMKTAYAAIAGAPACQGKPGMVASLQTFGAFANWNPHIHAIVTDGLLEKGGNFTPLPCPPAELLEEVFRRLLLRQLSAESRLHDATVARLLSWKHSGFSVYARQGLAKPDSDHTQHIARYLTRAPVRLDALAITDSGAALLTTPPDPRSKDSEIEFDPLDWVHAICTQIPDKGQHLVRYYGAYANRVRSSYRRHDTRPLATTLNEPAANDQTVIDPIPEAADPPAIISRRRSWARLLRKILEVDPLLCPDCKVEMKVVSVIQDPRVIDRILKHLRSGRGHDPFKARAPPAA